MFDEKKLGRKFREAIPIINFDTWNWPIFHRKIMSQLPAVILIFKYEQKKTTRFVRQTITWIKVSFIFTQSFRDIVKKKT